MPLGNATGKHIVTIEGINSDDDSLTPVQQALIDESGTQCGFCTVGFVMSLTGFCIDETAKTPEMAGSSIDGNICRCTGYKSIERAANRICGTVSESRPPAADGETSKTPLLTNEGQPSGRGGSLRRAIEKLIVPAYFDDIAFRLTSLNDNAGPPEGGTPNVHVGGGTDLYVQGPEAMVESTAYHLFYDETLRGIRDTGECIEIGASATVTDLLVSPVMQGIFPNLYKHLKLVSSTPIRNMATLAGNFVNASPIGDMTVWFLALDAEIQVRTGTPLLPEEGWPKAGVEGGDRVLPLRDFYLGYKQLAKSDDEYITAIRFKKPGTSFRFNFEKVCKRTYLDIATVNTAISLTIPQPSAAASGLARMNEVHVSAGGVAPVPLYLKKASTFLSGKEINEQTIIEANEIIQSEISPISDVRGTSEYKRLLLSRLFRAHFVELFGI